MSSTPPLSSLFPPETGLLRVMEKLAAGLKASHPGRTYTVVICGGSAAQLHLGPEHRPTTDLDAEIAPYPHGFNFQELDYQEGNGDDKKVYFWDENFSPTIGLLEEDYLLRALEVAPLSFDNIKTYVLDPHDLVINKLTRRQDPDRTDTAALANAGLLDTEYLEILIEKAITANPISAARNRHHAIACLEMVASIALTRQLG